MNRLSTKIELVGNMHSQFKNHTNHLNHILVFFVIFSCFPRVLVENLVFRLQYKFNLL